MIQRPLDPQQPQGVQIDVHYLVVPALARNKQRDPVLMLAGGPGQSAIGVAPAVLPRLTRLNYRRDLVFIDQRGTGRSAPLKCADDDARTQLQPQALQVDAAQRLLGEEIVADMVGHAVVGSSDSGSGRDASAPCAERHPGGRHAAACREKRLARGRKQGEESGGFCCQVPPNPA